MPFDKNIKTELESNNVYKDTRRDQFFIPAENSVDAINDPDKAVASGWHVDAQGTPLLNVPAVVSCADIRELSDDERDEISGRSSPSM